MKASSFMLEIRHAHFSYGVRSVLRDVSCVFAPGKLTGIIGANGAGKSTLLRLLAGVAEPKNGDVLLEGQSLSAVSLTQRARHISLLPQKEHIPFPFTALEIVLMGRAPCAPAWGFDTPQDVMLARTALEQLDAADLAARRFDMLSSGEQQRVLLARALAQQAPIMLLDEPLTHLDPRHQLLLLQLLRRHCAHERHLVALTLHDLHIAACCDHLLLLAEEHIVAAGPAADVLQPHHMRTAFGIDFPLHLC